MSKLMQALRRKKRDTVHEEVAPSEPKAKKKYIQKKKRDNPIDLLKPTTFQSLLRQFHSNKETMKVLDEQNKNVKNQLEDYVKKNGGADAKGNRMLAMGGLVATLRVSTFRQLNASAVEKLVHKLKKQNRITPKDAKRIIVEEYTLTMTASQYNQLRRQLEDLGVMTQREVKINEDELKMLVAEGKTTLESVMSCYEVEERTAFYTDREKKGDT